LPASRRYERLLHGPAPGQFLLLGSASIDLLRQSSESLAGRIAHCELKPFDALEIEPEDRDRLFLVTRCVKLCFT
jgi:hypothetical protein